jgi:hypothetical protein
MSSLAPGPRLAIMFVGLAVPSVDVLPGLKTTYANIEDPRVIPSSVAPECLG